MSKGLREFYYREDVKAVIDTIRSYLDIIEKASKETTSEHATYLTGKAINVKDDWMPIIIDNLKRLT